MAQTTGAQVSETAHNRTLVERFFDDFSSGRVDRAFTLLADDGTWWAAGNLYSGDRRITGEFTKAEYLDLVGEIVKAFPRGIRFTIHAMTAEGDRVAAEVESYGEHANGKRYNNHYHFLFVVRDGKFGVVKEYNDTHHLYELIQD